MRTKFDNYKEEQEYKEAYEKSETYFAIFWFYARWKGYDILNCELRMAWADYCKQDDRQVIEMKEYIGYKPIRREALRDRFRDKVASIKEAQANERKN